MTAPVLIVTGCSGVGKSTVSQQLSVRIESAVHIPADVFYRFFDDPWPDGTTPEGARRYEVVGAAIGASVVQLAIGGHAVVLDSAILPEKLSGFARIAAGRGVQVHYAVLQADLDVCWTRAKGRDPDYTWEIGSFKDFHSRFANVSHEDPHAIDASGTVEEVCQQLESAFRSGRLAWAP